MTIHSPNVKRRLTWASQPALKFKASDSLFSGQGPGWQNVNIQLRGVTKGKTMVSRRSDHGGIIGT
jgi:hypothetical protein